MKRIVPFVLSATVVFSIFFGLVWLIVRILAQDFPVLGSVVGELSFAISILLTCYVTYSVTVEQDEEMISKEMMSSEPVPVCTSFQSRPAARNSSAPALT